MNSVEFDAVINFGSREELKAELAGLWAEEKLLSRALERVSVKKKRVVEALAVRQEREVKVGELKK